MVLRGKPHIVYVATDQMWRHLSEPLGVIDQCQIVPDLRVAEIVPITDPAVRDIGEQTPKLAFGRKGLDSDAIFDGESDACGSGVSLDRLKPLYNAIVHRCRLALLN